MFNNRTQLVQSRGFLLGFRLLVVFISVTAGAVSLSFTPFDLKALELWWLVTIALSFLIAGMVLFTRWQLAGIVAAAFLIGASSQLALTKPDWFQSINISGTHNTIYLVAILLQATVSALTFYLRRTNFGLGSTARSLVSFKTVLFVCVVLGSSVTAFEYIARVEIDALLFQLIYAAVFLTINMMSLAALFFSLPEDGLVRLKRLAAKMISLPGRPAQEYPLDRLVPVIAALWVFAMAALLCVVAFERQPHVEDEVAYLFQAKTLLKGQIDVPAPVIPEAFEHYLLDSVDGRWYALTSPGWAVLLSPGVAMNLAWLVNPILAALTVLLAHAFMCKVANRGSANLLVVFLAISPWFLAMSASLMNHTASLFLVLASWLALVNARSKRSVLLAFLAGLCMGMLFLTRSLDGLIIGMLTGLWTLSFLPMRRGPLLPVAYALGCIAVGALIFPFNAAITGDILTTPLNHYLDQLWHPGANRLGFGADIGPPNQWGRLDLFLGHSPVEALANLQHNTYMLNFELFGWSIGSLFLVFVHLLWGRWVRVEIYSAIFILLLFGIYSLYWFNASFYIGPRYWFIALIPLVLISMGGLRTLAQRAAGLSNVSNAGTRIGVVLVVLGLMGLVSFLPWRGTLKYFEHRGYHADYREIRREMGDTKGLIFISKSSDSDFGSAMVFNEPVLAESRVIFARDLGPESNRTVAEAYPGRLIYFAKGRSRENARVVITQGPFALDSTKQTD